MAHMKKLADEALVPWRTNILELALDELANVLAHVDFADQIARLASVCHTFKATVAGATQARVAAARSLCDFGGASTELHRALDGDTEHPNWLKPKLLAVRWVEALHARPRRQLAGGEYHSLCISSCDGAPALYSWGASNVREDHMYHWQLGRGEGGRSQK
jgi:hypothetical protein